MVKELNQYTGREQQMKGVVTNNTQLFVFGVTLPRGHGHRGQISGFVKAMLFGIIARCPDFITILQVAAQESERIHLSFRIPVMQRLVVHSYIPSLLVYVLDME